MNRKVFALIILAPALLLMSGCSDAGAILESEASDPGAVAASTNEVPSVESGEMPLPTAMNSITPTADSLLPTVTPEPVAEVAPPPAFSEQLRATDPATVQIGAGRPQLIEFFAFW